MKKMLVFVLSLVYVLSLVGCYNTPDVPAEIEIDIDSVVMTRWSDGIESHERVTITDKETIAELLVMHNSLRTKDTKQSWNSDKHMWIHFRQDGKHIIEWFVSPSGDDWNNSALIMYSTTMDDEGYQIIKNEFDYNRLFEIFNGATE